MIKSFSSGRCRGTQNIFFSQVLGSSSAMELREMIYGKPYLHKKCFNWFIFIFLQHCFLGRNAHFKNGFSV